MPEDEANRALRDEVEAKLPTASLTTLQFDVAHWKDISHDSAKLLSFTRPRDLDAALGPEVY